ncbi:glycoside hydrolase family 3 N-terminal domain-containing protein [Cellulomonas triticagri]|uniref:Beta-glucosidase n=1 Tax=Cellulomonas triticagri TaxID=2483352 RepID=A0A3M2J7W0_9CELL|nr:glycoside hydrolase family 3 N-terminal domain-containing protein [Cellulomonas triticagri]RMI09499.1 beta-glucosidase [Cellulomonas triticagri]
MSRKQPRRLSTPVAIGAYTLCAALAGGLVVGNVYASTYSDLISVYLDQSTQKVVTADGAEGDADYFPATYTDEAERDAYLADVGTRISAGGITLIQDDGVLPLTGGARISVFGQDSVDPVYGGTGAGSLDASTAVDLEQSFADAGFEVNPVLREFYASGPGAEYRKTVPDVYGEGEFAVNEVPQSAYTAEVTASYADYADAAVVVLGRSGGESGDLGMTPDADGSTYLQLTREERDLLTAVTTEFDDVVLLLNTQNPVELGFLDEYPVDATLWVGAFGQTGAAAVGQVLSGEVNPSGALVDTYAYDSLSAPANANLGSYDIVNSEVDRGNQYMVYAEGVYVGYRYYETRYEDVVLGNEDPAAFDYATAVQFPFGHGLSYTTFDWTDYAVTEGDDAFTVEVTVTNAGDVAGRDVVQVYLQQPYTDADRTAGVEKPAVELAGYAKTGDLAPGEQETVAVEVPRELMKAYDSEGAGTYVVGAGDYYLAAGHDAHDALNNVLAAKGFTTADGMTAEGDATFTHQVTVDAADTTTYAVSQATGEAITNQFEDVDIRRYDPEFTYLSRADWTGTWPTTYADGAWTAPEQLLADLEIPDVEDPDATEPVTGTVSDEFGELTAAMLVGEEHDAPAWDALLDQMTVAEMDELVRVGGYATKRVDSVQLPATVDKDGPAGISDTLVGGQSGMGYPPAIVLASTWDDALAEEFGAAIGEDSIALGVAGWYGPAANIHRSPYSGRNFEYYAEDGLLSGAMSAAVVDGAQSKGVLVFAKHFALNDQETNRIGLATFADEQAIRQVYLTPFEMMVRDADARGMMASMNRLGARWSGAHEGLMTSALRDEWGFRGVVVTDQASFSVFAYEDLRAGLAAGTDLWLNTDATLWKLSDADMTPSVLADMRRASHNIAYAVTASNAMNGLAADSRLVAVTPPWQWALWAADAVLGLLMVGAVVLVTRKLVRQRREGAAPATA